MEETYEFECMRAELLGIEKPNKEEFQKARDFRQQNNQELEDEQCNLLEQQDDALKATGGKLNELNSILSSTQQKLNSFKQTACGSLSNIFNRSTQSCSVDVNDAIDNTKQEPESNGIKKVLDADDNMQQCSDADGDIRPVIPTEVIRNAKQVDMQKKMSSQLENLDSLLYKAEHAEISMSQQTKQIRKMAK